MEKDELQSGIPLLARGCVQVAYELSRIVSESGKTTLLPHGAMGVSPGCSEMVADASNLSMILVVANNLLMQYQRRWGERGFPEPEEI